MIKYIYWLIFRKKVRKFSGHRNPPTPPSPRPTPRSRSSFSVKLDEKIKESKGVNQPIIDRTTIPPNK